MANPFFTGEGEDAASGMHVGVFGHSLCKGIFEGKESQISAALQKQGIAANIATTAKSGSNIIWALSELKKSEEKFDSIVLYTGVNDYWRPFEKVKSDFEALFSEAASRAGKVHVFNIANYDDGNGSMEKIAKLNRFISDYISSHAEKFSLVDINKCASDRKDDPKVLHPAQSYAAYREFFIGSMANDVSGAQQAQQRLAVR